MSIIGWILLGLIAGFIGSKIVNKTGSGVIMDIVLGIVGAIVGGIARLVATTSDAAVVVSWNHRGSARVRGWSAANVSARAAAFGSQQGSEHAYAAAQLRDAPFGSGRKCGDFAKAAGPQRPANHGAVLAPEHAAFAADAELAGSAGASQTGA